MRSIGQIAKKLKFWGWLSILVLFANVVNAHEIHLKSGKIIRTQSVLEQDGMIIYQTKGGGTVKINKELVQQIIYTEPTPAPVSQKKGGGLVAFYPFQRNANDTIDPQNNGSVHGCKLVADRVGTLNNAYRFDGIDDYIQLPTPILSTSPFSVSLWFNAYAIKSEGQYLISNGGYPGVSQGMYCKLMGRNETYDSQSSWPKSGIQCGVNSSNGFFAIVTKEAITVEYWHHVVFLWDGVPDEEHIFIFFDGKLASPIKETGTREKASSPGNMRIGAPSNDSLEGLFNGKIDDLYFYNRSLTLDEIQQLSYYDRQQHKPYIPESDEE